MKLWLDDERNPPKNQKGWTWVKTWEEVKEALLKDPLDPVRVMSFDHDLGPDTLDGYEIIKRISWEIPERYPWEVKAHSRNVVGKENILAYDRWYRRMTTDDEETA